MTPYETLNDVPRNAWFCRTGPKHLTSTTLWVQIDSVDRSDNSVTVGGRYWLPHEMLGAWVWTDDPFAEVVDVRQCGK